MLLTQQSALLRAGRKEVRSGSCDLQEAEDFVPRGSEDSSCSNALLEMSDLSRAVLSPSLQGEGCFY